MKKYHILFFILEDQTYSRGEDFLAESEIEALQFYKEKYPETIFAAMYIRN